LSRRWRRCLARFARKEDGAMIIFCVMIFGMMLAIGGLSFDLMRYEMHRDRLQATLDRAVLAAASLNQERDPTEVVLDYFAKAGMSDYIDAGDVTVTPGFGSRKVEAVARIHVPLHHGTFRAFTAQGSDENTLIAEARGAAEEGIGDVEISMVLDVSGSMGDYSRLVNLKSAANQFLNTVYDNSTQGGTVTTSVVPYNAQVLAGQQLLDYFPNITDRHQNSSCLNFVTNDYSNTAMPLTTAYEQTLHFDAYIDEGDTWWDLGEDFDPDCKTHSWREILLWETNKTTIQNYINAFWAAGNTATNIGAKWGTALLDPAMQPVVTDMISNSQLDPAAAGRPFDYGEGLAMKVLIFMTDGDNTDTHRMGNYRSGDSFVWKYEQGNDVYYSIWHEGPNSTPEFSYETETQTEWEQHWQQIWYCDWYYWNGNCGDWDYYWDDYWVEVVTEEPVNKWFIVYNTAVNAGGDTQWMWKPTPYDNWGTYEEFTPIHPTTGEVRVKRLTWDEVWAEIPPEYFSDYILYRMDTLSWNDENAYDWAVEEFGLTEKDPQFTAACQAAKNEGVIVFTIGLEVSNHSDGLLETCASSTSHYYDVENLDISNAFQAIATQINQLRLVQ